MDKLSSFKHEKIKFNIFNSLRDFNPTLKEIQSLLLILLPEIVKQFNFLKSQKKAESILISVFCSESSYISNSVKLSNPYINFNSLFLTRAIYICFLCAPVRYLKPSSIRPKNFLYSLDMYKRGFQVASLINLKIILFFALSINKHLKTVLG